MDVRKAPAWHRWWIRLLHVPVRMETAAVSPLSGAVTGYVTLFLAFTWPLALSPARQVVCDKMDGFFDMLLFWYADQGRLLGSTTHALFFPWGVPMGPEHAYWLVPYMSVPLQWLHLPLPLIFNLLCGLFFVATATSIFQLARDLEVRAAGAFLAGALFVISPAYLNELSAGIPENLAVQWLVWFILLARRARLDPSRGRVYGSGACFVLAWLTSWYLGAFAALFCFILPLRRLRPGLVMAALIIVGPFLYACHSMGASLGKTYDVQMARALMAGTEPEPHAFEGVLSEFTARDVLRQGTMQMLSNSSDFGGLLARTRPGWMRDTLPGLLLIGLAVLGMMTAPRRALPWAGMLLLFTFLAVGPVLLWQGQWVAVMPTSWLYEHVPMLARLRPVRFMLPASLCLALLAGFAFPRLRSGTAAAVVLVALVALAWIEVDRVQVAQYRVQPTSAAIPETYRNLAAEPDAERKGIIDVPLMPFDPMVGKHLYYQTAHHHPLLNYDFVSLQSMQELGRKTRGNSILTAVLGQPGALRRKDAEALARLGFEYLILHTAVAQSDPRFDRAFLFDPTLYDDLRRAYGEPRVAAADHLLLFNMQRVEPGAWNPNGTLRHLDDETRVGPSFMVETPPGAPQPRLLGTVAGSGGRHASAMCGWLRGRGALVRAMEGGRPLGTTASGTEDWQWFRVPLAPLRAGAQGSTVEFWLDSSPNGPGYREAEVSGLSLWRSASAAEAASPSAPGAAPPAR